MKGSIDVYHATVLSTVASIEAQGFRDTPMGKWRPPGVFVSDMPLNEAEIAGPRRTAWFRIKVTKVLLVGREYQPGETDWSVWLVPAALLNQCSFRQISDDEVDAIRSAPGMPIILEDVDDDDS
jgi:hypothetical protein